MELFTGGKARAKRVVNATPEQVFDVWTDPKLLAQWFVCSDILPVSVAVDLRVGGKYRIAWDSAQIGGKKAVIGAYREISKPTRLSFTWGWEGPGWYETLVRVELTKHPQGTTVSVEHDRLATDQENQEHQSGWWSCLDSLATQVTKPKSNG